MEDDTMVQSIQEMVEKKILLYHDLLRCFQEERTALIQVDVEALWHISSEKDALCSKIALLRKDITAAAAPWIKLDPFDLNVLLPVIPKTHFSLLSKSGQVLIRLKKEIQELRRHNMVFMNDSLQFLDDMMAIISRAGRSDAPKVYNRRCSFNKGKSMQLLSREV